MVFFDMGSICASIKHVEKSFIECEIQNDGCIYENSQVTFSCITGQSHGDSNLFDETTINGLTGLIDPKE